jgi:hypothetical protein
MIRKPECNFYTHCLTTAALTDSGFECIDCQRFERSDAPVEDFAPYLKLLARIFPNAPCVIATRDNAARAGGYVWA